MVMVVMRVVMEMVMVMMRVMVMVVMLMIFQNNRSKCCGRLLTRGGTSDPGGLLVSPLPPSLVSGAIYNPENLLSPLHVFWPALVPAWR